MHRVPRRPAVQKLPAGIVSSVVLLVPDSLHSRDAVCAACVLACSPWRRPACQWQGLSVAAASLGGGQHNAASQRVFLLRHAETEHPCKPVFAYSLQTAHANRNASRAVKPSFQSPQLECCCCHTVQLPVCL